MGIIVVVVIGLIAGLILSVASIVFAVPVAEATAALVVLLAVPAMQPLWLLEPLRLVSAPRADRMLLLNVQKF